MPLGGSKNSKTSKKNKPSVKRKESKKNEKEERGKKKICRKHATGGRCGKPVDHFFALRASQLLSTGTGTLRRPPVTRSL